MKRLALVSLMFFSTICFADPRMWDTLGVAIRQGEYIHWEPQTVLRADGSTLVVWSDMRTGERDIYGQRISADGDILWSDGGISLCGDPAPQGEPVAIAVDDGWIVAWVDYRNSDESDCRSSAEDSCGDIYAQKVTLTGQRVWPDNNFTGVAVDVYPSRVQYESLQIVLAADGGAYLAWQDSRGAESYSEILVQRISANGVVQWPQPVGLSDNPGEQVEPEIASDGLGNLLAIWRTFNEQQVLDLFVGKLDPDGVRLWGTDGIRVADVAGSRFMGQIVPDGSGGGIVAWADWRGSSGDVYAQRYSANGEAQWAANGVVVCNAPNTQIPTQLAPSFQNGTRDGALVIWTDEGTDGYHYQVFGQKLAMDGSVLWGSLGVHLAGDSIHSSNYTEALASDLQGGAVCLWDMGTADTTGSPPGVFGSRLDAAGNYLWGEDGVCLECGGIGQSQPAVQVVNDHVLILASATGTASMSSGIRCQVANLSDGQPWFPNDGIAIVNGLCDGAYGANGVPLSNQRMAITWVDLREFWITIPLYYQILTTEGEIERQRNGSILLRPNPADGYWVTSPVISSDGSGGFFAVCRTQGYAPFPILFAHVNSAGERVTPETGVEAVQPVANQSLRNPRCAPDGLGGAFVAYEVMHSANPGYFNDVRVMQFSGDGAPLWAAPLELTTDEVCFLGSSIVPGIDLACLVLWTTGDSTASLRAAAVNTAGEVAWITTLQEETVVEGEVWVVSDNAGGAVVLWLDRRTPPNYTLYGQHLEANGSTTWPDGGIVIAGFAWRWIDVATAANSIRDAYIVWANGPDEANTDILGQHISLDGTVLWPQGGLTICSAPGQQFLPAASCDANGGLFTTWTDKRDGTARIWGTHLDPTGNPVADPYWVEHQGGLVSPADREAEVSTIIADESGFTVAWRHSNTQGPYLPQIDVYSQRISDLATPAEPRGTLPLRYALRQNFPNPFNPVTTLEFDIPVAGRVCLKVFDLLGRETVTLANRPMTAGTHRVAFDATALPSGVYFYRLQSGAFSMTRKMVLLK